MINTQNEYTFCMYQSLLSRETAYIYVRIDKIGLEWPPTELDVEERKRSVWPLEI